MPNYSGAEYSVTIGTQDQSGQPIGNATVDLIANHVFRLDTINPIVFDAGFKTADIRKQGRRTLSAEDRVQTYGGQWTWDFDYLVENEAVAQVLLTAITNTGADTSTQLNLTESLLAPSTTAYADGATGTNDVTCGIIINSPDADEDHLLHSAVLQNLTISMDADTDGGRPRLSGQFMSGYAPVIGTDSTTPATTNHDYDHNLFDCTTATIGGHDVIVKAINVTIENPANTIGWTKNGSIVETDGYVRGANVNVTGSITIKLDGTMSATFLDDWIANTNTSIVVSEGSDLYIGVPTAKISGYNPDYAREGAFVEIPFVGTTGAQGSGVITTLKIT